jgi:flagellar hook assembly protein FlgD
VSWTPRDNGPARLSVYDITGAEVARFIDRSPGAGRHQVLWDGRRSDGQPAAAGTYILRLTGGNHSETRPVLKVE